MENKVLIKVKEAGKGREENPFLRVNGNIPEDNLTRIKYESFECAVLTLPAFQQDGKTPLEPGRYEVELVWQVKNLQMYRDQEWHHLGNHVPMGMELPVRQIYRAISPSVGEVEDVKVDKPVLIPLADVERIVHEVIELVESLKVINPDSVLLKQTNLSIRQCTLCLTTVLTKLKSV